MPSSGDKPDEVFVKLFVSAYENFAWKDSEICWLDKYVDGAVEALVTRSDGETMAIEHTLIEPFVGNKRDFAAFEQSLEALRSDQSLAVHNAGIEVYIPAGAMDGQKPAKRQKIVESVRSWIATNRLQLREGQHRYECEVPGEPTITLTVKFKPWRNANSPPGILVVGRQQIVNDLDKVVEKALRRKLPKLVNTRAARHILLLEREDFTFHPELIFAEIERQRPSFPLLNGVDEIWEVETVGYKSIGYVGFDMAVGPNGPATMCFQNGMLTGHSGKDGIPSSM
jgi:hypothetical protein